MNTFLSQSVLFLGSGYTFEARDSPALGDNTLCDGIMSLAAATKHTTALAKVCSRIEQILSLPNWPGHPFDVPIHALHWPNTRKKNPRGSQNGWEMWCGLGFRVGLKAAQSKVHLSIHEHGSQYLTTISPFKDKA